MSTGNSAASAASPQTQPQLSGGLFLVGTVIAVRTEEKEWEKTKYTQTTVSVSDGEPLHSDRYIDPAKQQPESFKGIARVHPWHEPDHDRAQTDSPASDGEKARRM